MGRTLAVWRKQYLTRFDTDRASDGPTEAVTWGLPWPEPEVTEVPVRLEIDQARGMRAEAADVEVEISDPLYHRLVRVDDFELGGTPNLLSTVLIPCRAVAIRIAGAPVPGQPKVATGPARLLHLVPPPPRASSTSCLLHLVPPPPRASPTPRAGATRPLAGHQAASPGGCQRHCGSCRRRSTCPEPPTWGFANRRSGYPRLLTSRSTCAEVGVPDLDTHAVAQAVHDLGSAMWFGGATMGVVGVNKSGRDLSQGIDRIRVAKSGWARFSPLEWAGIGATMLAGLQLTRSSTSRLTMHRSYRSLGAVKAGVTVVGALATAYAAFCGAKIASLAEQAQQRGEEVEVQDATTPTPRTTDNIARWQRQQQVVQYVVPVMAGANIALGSYLTGSYRPSATLKGMMRTLRR